MMRNHPDQKEAEEMLGVTMWGTPLAQDERAAYYDRGKCKMGEQVNEIENARETGMTLNPDWVETLMGYPIGWTDPDGPCLSEMLNTIGSHIEPQNGKSTEPIG